MAKGFEIIIKTKGTTARNSLPQLIPMCAERIKTEWQKLARQNLHSTASIYADALQVEHQTNQSIVTLKGDFPNALERGAPAFDMKPGFLGSSKAKRDAKGNTYFTVPMGLKAPGSGNRGPSPPVIPWSVYKSVSRSPIGTTHKLPLKYEDLGIRTRLSPDPQSWGHYTWKTSPFENIKKTAGPGGRGAYMTFRRVSEKSDPNSWIHPGFRTLNLAKRVTAMASEIVSKTFADLVG